jgi:hypothetical protein
MQTGRHDPNNTPPCSFTSSSDAFILHETHSAVPHQDSKQLPISLARSMRDDEVFLDQSAASTLFLPFSRRAFDASKSSMAPAFPPGKPPSYAKLGNEVGVGSEEGVRAFF